MRVENPANASHCLSSSDLLPLIEQGNKEYKMDEVQLGSHTIRSHGFAIARTHMHDWLILVLLVVIWVVILIIHPFYRFVGKDMMDDLRYPLQSNTVPVWAVPMYAVLLPVLIFIFVYIRRRDVYDLHHAVLGLLFSVLVTAVITDSIKNAVGRPRPDFFWRCFPDGKDVYDKWGNVICHGDKSVIREGHKSFPNCNHWRISGFVLLGPLPGWVFFHFTCPERSKHLTVEDMLQNYVSFFSLCWLHHLWAFLEWMTIGTTGKMSLLVSPRARSGYILLLAVLPATIRCKWFRDLCLFPSNRGVDCKYNKHNQCRESSKCNDRRDSDCEPTRTNR
ncbi:hypothetical protein ES332_D07G087200v1 [Gossypium tomentosum]|uniref:Phosphatidic acid phosphatase type 2/haloperoxidase domain-containing protein n=2 Tax=Gossypium tomentosum TaxID=34277 RepID=A0A5D2K4G3_GOSTO|nr:hypothetical protein ES332_D07G087200v1 [Gossypium tomentosum]TYH61985.1 hypothetical protein ES332_D07G087200v1 [Gossypium tomentosum]